MSLISLKYVFAGTSEPARADLARIQRQGQPGDLGAEVRQPMRQPGALEPGIASYQNRAALPKIRSTLTKLSRADFRHSTSPRAGACHARYPLPARIHDACKRPTALRAPVAPSACVPNSFITVDVVEHLGERTKNPPLMLAPSPAGFSVKLVTAWSSDISSAPKRPGRHHRRNRSEPALRSMKVVKFRRYPRRRRRRRRSGKSPRHQDSRARA